MIVGGKGITVGVQGVTFQIWRDVS